MNPQPQILESLPYSTVRIDCDYSNGASGTGTGFLFDFLRRPDGSAIPVVITNKHVIETATVGRLVFTKFNALRNGPSSETELITLDRFEERWRMHPDPEVDLCAMPLGPVSATLGQIGIGLFYVPFNSDLIRPNTDLKAIEDVLMIGYPDGLWDEFNNKPIIRKGITATHPRQDYMGRKEFMIDAACFPGSSGSPVVIYNSGLITDGLGIRGIGNQSLRLLGVLYAGPTMTVTGEINITDIPTVQHGTTISELMIHLGCVIKSERILELEDLFRSSSI